MASSRFKHRDDMEFSTNIPDKEERKRVRRVRVEGEMTAQDDDGKKTTKAEDENVAQTNHFICKHSSYQMADSLAHLDKKKGSGIDTVTAVRVAADDRETQRRMAEEHTRQERLQRLQ
ncbi:unnamed protein product, partial [Choristocarpus tenellus]